MAVTAGLVFFDFAYFREQMCTIICPYARLQSVLLDQRSLIIGYDEKRGKAKPHVTGHGIPRCCAPPPPETFDADLGRSATQIRQRRGFILSREGDAAKGALLPVVVNIVGEKGVVAGARNTRFACYRHIVGG